MFKKLILSYLILVSPLIASNNKADEEIARGLSPTKVVQQKEKTAEEIIAECQHQPEFMSCTTWLRQEYPDFSEDKFSSHPLFDVVRIGMQLADFEVDTLESFMHVFMETDMEECNVECLMDLRQNAMATKFLVGSLIEILFQKKNIESFLGEYFLDRLQKVVIYQAEKSLRKDKVTFDKKNVEKVLNFNEISNDDPVKIGFLRSYNAKNKIIRDLLYYLKEQKTRPLFERLPSNLVNLIRISSSLHPLLNNESDEWLGYDEALEVGEARNFLANAKSLNINLASFFREEKITGVRIPKNAKKLSEMPIPKFLLEGLKEEKASKNKRKKLRKKTREILEKTENAEKSPLNTNAIMTDKGLGEKEESPDSMQILTGSQAPMLPNAALLEPSESENAEVTLPNDVMKKEKEPTLSSQNESTVLKITTRKNRKKNRNERKGDDLNVDIGKSAANKHLKTIYDIFSPKGYAHLNSDKIVAAWNHVLKGKGYHKENTGRSHQPLYATLRDGSRVVLGLFKSSGYGPNYIRYVREAFDKIGFGRNWLEKQGYILQ